MMHDLNLIFLINGGFWQNVSADTLAIVLVTLAVNFVVIFLQWIGKYIQNKKESRETYKTCSHHLNRISEKSEKLADHYQQYANHKIKLASGVGPTAPFVTAIGIERLMEVPYQKLFNTFTNKQNIDDAISCVVSFRDIIDRVEYHQKIFYKEDGEIRDKLAELYTSYKDEVVSYMDQVLRAYSRDSKEGELWANLNNMFGEELNRKDQKGEFKSIFEFSIKNIHESMVKYQRYLKKEREQEDSKLLSIVIKGKMVLQKYEELKAKINSIKSFYKEISNNILELNSDLNNEKKKLKWRGPFVLKFLA